MQKILFLLVVLTLSGCAVEKNWGAAGGSKADGTVKLAYTYDMFEVPEVNRSQAIEIATKRCEAWGYKKAVPFDFVNSQCQQMTGSGCARTMVSQEFQCE